MAAAATIKIVRVYQTGVNVFIHIHTSFEARDSVDWVVLLYLFFIIFYETTCLQVAFTAVETRQLCVSSVGKEHGV